MSPRVIASVTPDMNAIPVAVGMGCERTGYDPDDDDDDYGYGDTDRDDIDDDDPDDDDDFDE